VGTLAEKIMELIAVMFRRDNLICLHGTKCVDKRPEEFEKNT